MNIISAQVLVLTVHECGPDQREVADSEIVCKQGTKGRVGKGETGKSRKRQRKVGSVAPESDQSDGESPSKDDSEGQRDRFLFSFTFPPDVEQHYMGTICSLYLSLSEPLLQRSQQQHATGTGCLETKSHRQGRPTVVASLPLGVSFDINTFTRIRRGRGSECFEETGWQGSIPLSLSFV